MKHIITITALLFLFSCTKEYEPKPLPLTAKANIIVINKTVNLDASQSYTAVGYQITKYNWTLAQSNPSFTFPEFNGEKISLTMPTGVYLFKLELYDNRGKTAYVYQSVEIR